MSQRNSITIQTHSTLETESFGERIGKALKGGEVIELISDLGGGKTALTRGIAKGFGSADRVMSPTFTISRIYTSGPLQLVHYDFYRLDDPGILRHELEESFNDERTVTVIEWAHIVQDVLPDKRLTITIDKTGDEARSFTIQYPQELEYLIEEYK
jgi:tRNA threonylcarbamoyladenosine biosynthesis protein TsaE